MTRAVTDRLTGVRRADRVWPAPGRPDRARGVGLLEVLLAVVLLSIGFLAAARMQVQGMSWTQNSYALSQAKYLVLDMSERMRANREGLRAGLYANLQTAAGTVEPACIAAATSCTPADIATADLHAWSQALHPADAASVATLPSAPGIDAGGTVTRDAATGAYNVSVSWAERTGNGPETRTVSVEVFSP